MSESKLPPYCEPGWPPDPKKTPVFACSSQEFAKFGSTEPLPLEFRFMGCVVIWPPHFQFIGPDERVLADCTSAEAVHAAHRLLTGAAQ